MSNMQKHAKETVTTRDMAKGKGGKTARPIGEVEVTQGEAAHDAARTVAPMGARVAVERERAPRRPRFTRTTTLRGPLRGSQRGVAPDDYNGVHNGARTSQRGPL